jgi:hypothetical protein
MKRFPAFLLAILILLQPFSSLWVYVSFKINQSQIAKTLCVQKEIKNNTCKGKCQLKKRLANAEKETEKQLPSNQKQKLESVCFISTKHLYLNYSFGINSVKKYSYIPDFYKASFSLNIFHPPQEMFI